MKKMKRLVALALSVVMVLAMSVVAFASVDLKDHSFEAYQIFAGTWSDNKLINITWGDGVNGDELLAELKTSTVFASCTDAASVAEVLGNYNEEDSQTTDFAKAVAKHLTSTATSGTGTVALPAAGYYLIVDKTSVQGQDNAKNLSILKASAAGTVTPSVKTDKPQLEKKVKDTNDTAGATTDWQDSADYDIGDRIPYQLKATLGDISDYNTYYVKFTDTMTHLTLDENSVKVTVGTTELSSGQYELQWDDSAKKMTVSIANVKAKGIDATNGTVITVDYYATLDSNAVIGSVGNPNEAYLEYSNNPNKAGDGETGKTPTDKNIVFTYKVTANKVNQSGDPLKGAKFELFKKVKNNAGEDEWISKGEIDGTDKTEFSWSGLDDGDYKIEETQSPSGYNSIKPIEFTISATHDELSDSPKLTSLTGGDKFTGMVSTGTLTATIENKQGSTLPSTGGIGTTIFYVVGGILMAGAAVLLITKRRAEN